MESRRRESNMRLVRGDILKRDILNGGEVGANGRGRRQGVL